MHRSALTLLLTAALGAAAAQTSPPAQTSLPTSPALVSAGQTPGAAAPDGRLTPSAVSIEIGTYSGPLSSLLAAVARSAGYEVIFDTNVDGLSGAASAAVPAEAAAAPGSPAASASASPSSSPRPVVYNFRNAPFNEVWPLLMDVYGLSYDLTTVGSKSVLRVSANPIQRVIVLKNASSVDAVNQVKLFFGTPTYAETPVKDAQGNTTGVTRTLSDVKIDSPTLRIVADARTNALIVRGTNREVAEVARLAAQLDTQIGVAVTGGNAQVSQTVQRVYTVKGQQADIAAVLAAQYPNLKVTGVGQTGQLVITGAQNQIDAAVALLSQVDRPVPVVTVSGPVTVQRVFTLQNASAEDLKTVLEGTLQRALSQATGLVANPGSFLAADGTTIISPPASSAATPAVGSASGPAVTSGATPAAAPATIIADRRTNTLIVRGTQEQVTQIAEIIPTLDTRVPQINVQVRIQEIGETATRSLGLDWSAGFGNFVVKLASGALTSFFDPTTTLAGFNLGATLNALEQQNLTKRVYDGNITMQSGQRTVGSNASGAANASSGAAAHIQSGGRLELNIPSTAANVPSITRQIDYGVTLDFYTPQVAPDGSITLRVKGVVNQPSTAITGSTLPNLLNFTNSEAETTITFKNGETVLLSGLLGTNETTTSSGIPYLSSLPVVGALFGKQSTSTQRSQLLVVITGTTLQ